MTQEISSVQSMTSKDEIAHLYKQFDKTPNWDSAEVTQNILITGLNETDDELKNPDMTKKDLVAQVIRLTIMKDELDELIASKYDNKVSRLKLLQDPVIKDADALHREAKALVNPDDLKLVVSIAKKAIENISKKLSPHSEEINSLEIIKQTTQEGRTQLTDSQIKNLKTIRQLQDIIKFGQ